MPILGNAQWARFTLEETYGVFNADEEDAILYPRIRDGSALKINGTVDQQIERGADGYNRRLQRFGQRVPYTVDFACWLRPDQALILVPWAFKPVAEVLDSYTVDYWDGKKAHRMVGCVWQSNKLMSDDKSDGLVFAGSLVAKERDTSFTTFARPAQSLYPTKGPYEHRHSAGNITLSGAITGYSSLSIEVTNMIAMNFNESTRIQYAKFAGRDVNWTIRKTIENDTFRAAYEAGTVEGGAQVGWNVGSGEWGAAHSMIFDLNDKNYVLGYSDDKDFQQVQYEELSIGTFQDLGAGADMTLSIS